MNLYVKLLLASQVYLLTSARIKLQFLLRLVVAVVLVLALLSGIAPFKSAAAGHLCTMACCAGLHPHAAGSCHMELSPSGKPNKPSQKLAAEPAAEKLCGLPNADKVAMQGAVAGVMGMRTSESSLNLDDVTVEASDHCLVKSQTEGANRPSSGDSDQTPIVAHSADKPCPPECGSGPTVSRVRRSQDAATVARNARLRTTFVKQYFYRGKNLLILSSGHEQTHPRGPPTVS